jgi:hypothetical protein
MADFVSTARATRPYRVQYPDPIVLRPGDVVHLGERDSEYPGWIWGTSPQGRGGWIPEEFLKVFGETGTAIREYNAREVDLDEGDIVSVIEELLGWALVSKGDLVGWVPLSHLALSATPIDLPL